MPKSFSSSLIMLVIANSCVLLTLVVDLPAVILWFLLILSIPFNILGIIGVISLSRIRNE